MDAMEKKWSTRVEHFSEALWICSPSTILHCSIRGITIKAHLNPVMEVNIMPWHLAYTLLGNVTLKPSDKLLKSCPSGHILECRGVACAVPLLVDKIKVNLDFHIFDVLDLDLLLGSHIGKLLDASRGSLDKKLREGISAITPLFSENSMVMPLPKQNTFEEMMHVSTFTPSEPVLPELVEFSTSQGYDLEDPLHLCEDERSSSPLIEFEPLPTGPYHVVSDRGRESTLFIHDASLEMENSWAMEIYNAPTLESEGKDLIGKHGGFTLDLPQERCLHHVPPDSATLSAQSTHQDYNCLKVLSCKKFRRMVGDAYVYHKHCRFRECIAA
jgi:hypothetical protein